MTYRRHFVLATISGVVLGLASPVGAQDCTAGMLATEGHCCWAGQTYSASAGTCTGTPTCPAGMRLDAAGTSCELVLAEVQSVVAVGTLEVDALWPAAGDDGPPGGRRPRHERVPDTTIRDTGIVVFAASYLVGLGIAALVASIDDQFEHRDDYYFSYGPDAREFPTDCADLHAGLAFIPVVGDLIGSAIASSCPFGNYRHGVRVDTGTTGNVAPLIGSVFLTIGQLVGLSMALAGLSVTSDVIRIDAHTALELDLTVDPSGGAGLTLRF